MHHNFTFITAKGEGYTTTSHYSHRHACTWMITDSRQFDTHVSQYVEEEQVMHFWNYGIGTPALRLNFRFQYFRFINEVPLLGRYPLRIHFALIAKVNSQVSVATPKILVSEE